MKPATPEAYKLFHDGVQTLSRVEHNGIKIDLDYLSEAEKGLDQKIKDLGSQLYDDEVYELWRKKYGKKTNIDSSDQLGHVLFDELELPYVGERTATGKYSTDDEVLRTVNLPWVKKYLQRKKYYKARHTFLANIRNETVDGLLHPFFDLHTVQTFRSCIAKGTLIEIVRDVSKYPKGVPIEDVREGDFVYCYNDNLNLTIRKVLWAGKTGRREIIRLHWSAKGKKGHVDLTPEHRVRMASGQYVEACKLTIGQDFRRKSDSRHSAKIRTLAMGRNKDHIYETGNKEALHDHRLIYKKLIGKLKRSEVVHHKDGNHLNNTPANLEKMTQSEHAKIHVHASLTREARIKGSQKSLAMKRERQRLYGDAWPVGEDNPNWIHIGKIQFLRLLIAAGGRLTKLDHDFDTLKHKAKLLGIDLKVVKRRFDRNGNYICRGRLKSVYEESGRKGVKETFGINFYKVIQLLEERGFADVKLRRWIKQNERKSYNHKITKIEWLYKEVDVYDIEVEEFHNFIANEICVHNSSRSPNFQNFPSRDPEITKIIRTCFVAREGRQLLEMDFSGIEVRIACVYTKDPRLIDDFTTSGKDPHRDTASQLFCLPIEFLKENADWAKKTVRDWSKNRFVFPEFYGSVHFQCAPHIWESIIEKGPDGYKFKLPDGTSIKKHLAKKGIKELGEVHPDQIKQQGGTRSGTYVHHVKKVEEDFWNNRFKVYTQWKADWYASYLKVGGFRTLSGFKIEGVMKRNEVLNYPIQGFAFHCLLWTLIQLDKWLRKNKMRSLIVGQIHDSMVLDAVPKEVPIILEKVKELVSQGLPRHWPCIIVPMEIEAELCPIGGSWYDKKKV